MENRYILSIEFHSQGEISPYKMDDIIGFVDLKGMFRVGKIIEIKEIGNGVVDCFKVDCGNNIKRIAIYDYVIKPKSLLKNIKTEFKSIDGFPLRT